MKIYDKSQWEIGKLKLKDNAVPMIEVDREIDIDDLLRIKGHLYTVCVKSKNHVIVEEINVFELPDEPEEQIGTDEITCPYCMAELESFEMDDYDDDYECPYCHSHFSYQRNVVVEYDSQPILKATAIELN